MKRLRPGQYRAMEVSPWYLSRAQATVGKTLAHEASQDCAAGRLPAPGGPGMVQGRAPLGDDSLSRCSHEWSAHQPTQRMCQLGGRGTTDRRDLQNRPMS